MDSKKDDNKGHKTTRSVSEKQSTNKSKGSNSDQENRTGRANKPSKKKCDGILGILKDGESMVESTDDDSMVRDAAIIIANQKVEHYEIASYGSLAELARTLGFDEGAEILEGILLEEKETDMGLTELAAESVNEEAKKEE